MSLLNILPLTIVLTLDNLNIHLKLLMQTSKSGILQINEIINMDQVIPQSHLVLLLSLVQITIQHLKDSILRINLSIMVLLEDLNVLF